MSATEVTAATIHNDRDLYSWLVTAAASGSEVGPGGSASDSAQRREAVLDSALLTFARYGYRKA
jgi:hypothetical protein